MPEPDLHGWILRQVPLDANGRDAHGWRWGQPEMPLWHCADPEGIESLTVRAPTRAEAIEVMTAEGWPPKRFRRFNWEYRDVR